MTNVTKKEVNIELIRSEEALELVKQEVDRTLSKSPLIIREYTKHLMTSRGKFIRAVSVLICAEDAEGMIHKNAVKIAAAIEILHLATLVHDDIIDNAELRRGDVTLQKRYGRKTAVICGDYLLSVALRMAASIENKKDYLDMALPDYVGKVCLGELNQHVNNGNIDLSIFRYLKIISGKTAALFEASFFAGAIFSNCTENEVKRYRRLGFYIGMIFQLSDDCIDFEETVEGANKPVQSDFEQGVITLPLIHALSSLSEFKEKALAHSITRDDINTAVIKTGGLRFTRLMIDKFYNKSMRIIEQLDLSSHKKEQLINVLRKAARLS
ncbi:MAG: Polyprenyl synthetase [Herbinix sp.]|jgi:heptaprenyl diphosphate synthase|nr:Polyprenyl synthetase [Herbinix sp.]